MSYYCHKLFALQFYSILTFNRLLSFIISHIIWKTAINKWHLSHHISKHYDNLKDMIYILHLNFKRLSLFIKRYSQNGTYFAECGASINCEINCEMKIL